MLWLLKSLRPNQWIKNAFVLAALVFSKHLFDQSYVIRSGTAFVLFCLLSGAVYILNDILDLENDRLHPKKRYRPITSGKLGVRSAIAAALIIGLFVFWLGFWLNYQFGWVLLTYGVINLSYSFHLKNVVILDVLIISTGFLLRAIGGAFVIDVEISSWFILCTMLLSLFLGFGKRRAELILLDNAVGHRRILKDYTPQFLDQTIAVVTASTLVTYALYTMSPEVIKKLETENLNLTIPFVLYGLLRYLFLIYNKKQGDNPSSTVLNDPSLLITGILWIFTLATVLYI